LLTKPAVTSSKPTSGSGINICDGESCTLTAPAGFVAYTWSNGETGAQISVDESGIYSVIVEAAGGCESPASDPITITVNPFPIATITINDDLLIASNGDSYQWSNKGEVVSGATNQNYDFNALEYGVYSVDVTTKGCTTTSDDFIYLITASEHSQAALKIHPNPVIENKLYIESNESGLCRITDLLGQEVKQFSFGAGLNTMALHGISSGIYILTIQTGKNKKQVRIQKID
jgi:hypothetical protein